MTFAVDMTACSTGARPRRAGLRLGRSTTELDASGCCVREWMVEDVERLVVFAEDELEVVVVGGIVDRDRHQTRRSSPEQSHDDTVRLA